MGIKNLLYEIKKNANRENDDASRITQRSVFLGSWLVPQVLSLKNTASYSWNSDRKAKAKADPSTQYFFLLVRKENKQERRKIEKQGVII